MDGNTLNDGEQASKQRSSKNPAYVPAWLPAQTSLSDELWLGHVNQINRFFPKLLLVMMLIVVTESKLIQPVTSNKCSSSFLEALGLCGKFVHSIDGWIYVVTRQVKSPGSTFMEEL